MNQMHIYRIDYILNCAAGKDKLAIVVEQKWNGKRWKSEFTLQSMYLCIFISQTLFLYTKRHKNQIQDVENITKKTGNYKRFGIFVQMLESAMLNRSDSVCVDILTYEDLVQLRTRSKRSHDDVFSSTSMSKRYLKTSS